MNWIVAICCVAFAALGGEELAHYRNPASGPGLVQSALHMLPAGNLALASSVPMAEPVKKPATKSSAMGLPGSVDYDQLAKNMDGMALDGKYPDAGKKAAKVSLCIENVARNALKMPLVSIEETPEQTQDRKKSTGMMDKLNMVKATMNADADLVNGCRRYYFEG